MNSDKTYIRLTAAAKMLGLNRSVFYYYAKRKGLFTVKYDGAIAYVPRSEVEAIRGAVLRYGTDALKTKTFNS